MPKERLLERFSSFERDPLRRERTDQGRLVDSLLAHLRCILNTRQGAVPIAEDYGVPDFLDFLQRYPDSVREIELSIRQVIERYEPRLQGVQVVFVPRDDADLSLRFHINAQVRDGDKAPVSFETVVESDGMVVVRR